MTSRAEQPAFPQFTDEHLPHPRDDRGGISKREYFAGLAMQGIISSVGPWPQASDGPAIAKRAIAIADALLAELSK